MENKTALSYSSIDSYLDLLINQTFSILPLYEEHGVCQPLLNKTDNLIYRMQGFFAINDFDSDITTNILSYANSLKTLYKHNQIRRCVLKICSLLSKLKAVAT